MPANIDTADPPRTVRQATPRRRPHTVRHRRRNLQFDGGTTFQGHALDRLCEQHLIAGPADRAALATIAAACRLRCPADHDAGFQRRVIIWQGRIVTIVVRIVSGHRSIVTVYSTSVPRHRVHQDPEVLIVPDGVTFAQLRHHLDEARRHRHTNNCFAITV